MSKRTLIGFMLIILPVIMLGACTENPTEPKPDPTSTPIPTATPVPTPPIVAQISTTVYAMEKSGSYLYFRTEHSLMRVLATGGTPQTLVSGIDSNQSYTNRSFALDGSYLYYLNQDSGFKVYRILQTGGTPQVLADISAITYINFPIMTLKSLTVYSGYVYVNTDIGVIKVTIADGTKKLIEGNLYTNGLMASDLSYIYYFSSSSVMRKDRNSEIDNDGLLQLATGAMFLNLGQDNTSVYYSTNSSYLYRVSKTGGTPVQILNLSSSTSYINDRSLSFDGQYLYICGHRIFKRYNPSSGVFEDYTLATGYNAYAVTTDTSNVYFYETTGNIRRMSK